MSASILILSRFGLESPRGGAALRNVQNINACIDLGSVDLITIGENPSFESSGSLRGHHRFNTIELRNKRSQLKKLKDRYWYTTSMGHPLCDPYFYSEIESKICNLNSQNKFDFALVEELSLAKYIPLLRSLGCKVIFDAHNVECVLRSEMQAAHNKDEPHNPKQIKQKERSDYRIKKLEQMACTKSHAIWTCSDLDSAAIKNLFGERIIATTVPNGVNVSGYQLRKLEDTDWECIPLTMVYLGAYQYYPNEVAALQLINEILPLVQKVVPNAELRIIGRGPTDKMRSAAKGNPAINIVGEVDSIVDHIQDPCIFTLPLNLGGGTRLKILEAFAFRRPVVCTSKAVEGIDAKDGIHILRREESDEIAKAAIEVWNNSTLRNSLIQNSHELVSENFDWSTAKRSIENSFATLSEEP